MPTLDVRINWLIVRTRKALRNLSQSPEEDSASGKCFALNAQLRTLLKAKRARLRGAATVALPAFITFDGVTFRSTDDELPGIAAGPIVIDDD